MKSESDLEDVSIECHGKAKDKHIHISVGDAHKMSLVMFEQVHHCVM